MGYFLTCMGSLMNFKIFTSCKDFATAVVWTRKWFLSSVNPNVVYQLKQEIK